MKRKTIAVVFGGQSSEHEISCISAATIIDNINPETYKLILIGITKDGHWLKAASLEEVRNGNWIHSAAEAVISPDASKRTLIFTENGKMTEEPVDLVFPVLHGPYGEDGTIQGLLELAHIPYVGCGVLSSAVSMDKLYTKIIVDTLGIRQAAYVCVMASDLNNIEGITDKVEGKLKYPVFVKPSKAGSSKGVSKAADRGELVKALTEAAKHDLKILVEETIVGREIECGVLGGTEIRASGIGEVIAAADFYDYDSKYNNEDSSTVLDPEVPAGKDGEIRDAAVRIFKAVDGFGLARVDFFIENGTNEVVFNEINTFPGFTGISMYPMLWEHRGISKSRLVEKLIQMAFTRSGE